MYFVQSPFAWVFGILLCVCAQASKDKKFVHVDLLRIPRDAKADEENGETAFKSDFSSRESTSNDDIEVEFPPDYNKYKIPKFNPTQPMNLSIQLLLKKVLDLDELNEQIKLDVEFKVVWTDYEILKFYQNSNLSTSDGSLTKIRTIKDLTLDEIREKRITVNNPLLVDKLWKPNLFFENLLQVKQPFVMAKPITIKVLPEVGYFEYVTRCIITLDCEMDYKFYPADTQTCEFSLRGFSYTKRDLNLGWHNSGVWLDDLNLPSYDVRVDNLNINYLEEDDEDPAGDEFKVLGFSIHARRRLSYHIVQTYLASTFYIVITCLCFLLPVRLVEARIGICMTTLLTLTAMFASIRESTPIASYLKAIDAWVIGCIFFVFLTLMEFTLHIWMQAMKEDAQEKETEKLIETKTESKSRTTSAKKKLLKRLEVFDQCINLIEDYSFPAFISLLIVFSVVYWWWLISSSNYLDWNIDPAHNNIDTIE